MESIKRFTADFGLPRIIIIVFLNFFIIVFNFNIQLLQQFFCKQLSFKFQFNF